MYFVLISPAFAQTSSNFEVDQQNKIKRIDEIERQESLLRKQNFRDYSTTRHTTAESTENDSFKMKLQELIIDKNGENININPVDFIEPYLGKLIGKVDIFNLIKSIEKFLAQQGYVSSIVTIVPSNLSNGTLILKINWGRISKVTINGDDPKTINDKMLLMQLYPFAREKILNIRDIDQMIENGTNYNKIVKVTIVPDTIHDYSILDVTTEENNSLGYNFSIDNSGSGSSKKSGLYRYSLSAGFSDIIIGTDTLNVSANTRHISKDDDSYNYYWSGNYNFPVGPSSISLGVSNSKSGQKINQSNTNYDSKSNQLIFNASVSQVLYRAQQDKLTSSFEVNKRHAKNFYDSKLIEVNSNPYSDLSAGLQYVTVIAGSSFYADVKYNQGVDWFDGHKAGYNEKNHPVNFSRWVSNISLGKSISLMGNEFNFNSRASMQYSKYNILDIYRIGIGDEYTVRGFRNGNVLGDSGISLTNTLNMPVNKFQPFQITPFIGYDIGYVYKNDNEENTLMGMAIGTSGSWNNISANLTVGIPVSYSKHLNEIDPYTVYFNVSYAL